MGQVHAPIARRALFRHTGAHPRPVSGILITTMGKFSTAPQPVPSQSVDQMARHAEEAAAFLKLMANPHRLMILCHLQGAEMSVGELNAHLPVSQSALSQHLAILRNSGLVATRRDQQTIYYRLASPETSSIMDELYEQFCRR